MLSDLKESLLYKLSSATECQLSVPSPAGLSYLPHQLAAIDYIDRTQHTLLADPPGLGKTIIAIGYANLKRYRTMVVVCPASLQNNWVNEINKWSTEFSSDFSVQKYERKKKLFAENVLVTSYSSVDVGLIEYIRKEWNNSLDLLVFDESHYLKNEKAKRTKFCLNDLKPYASKVLAMSGTPVLNRPVELYTSIRHLCPKALGEDSSYMKYVFKYCGAKYDGFGLNVGGFSNMEELSIRLRSHFMIRRKKEVLNLPDIYPPNLVMLEKDSNVNKLIYKMSKFSAADILKMKGSTVGFEGLSVARKELGVSKIDQAIQYIHTQLEVRDKVVVFAHHREVVKQVAEAFQNSALICGETPVNERQKQVEKFQEDASCRVFVGSIMSAGVGITLTASDYVCFIEISYVPGENRQAMDRCHRIGQKNAVVVDFLLFENSLDHNILKTQTFKMSNIEELMNEQNNEQRQGTSSGQNNNIREDETING